MNREIFRERLKNARKGLGLSQSQLAVAVGVTPPAVTHWEKGTNEPAPKKLLEIAARLNINKNYLTGESDDPSLPSPLSFHEYHREYRVNEPQQEAKAPFEPGYRSMQIIGNEKVQEHAKRLMEEEYLESPEELLNWLLRQDLKRRERQARPKPGSLEAEMQDLDEQMKETFGDDDDDEVYDVDMTKPKKK
jgi:transcriptional regulator with XRE-family HTH domain